MSTHKYLLIYRIPCASDPDVQPSPEQMQTMLAQWDAWKAKFKTQIIELGDALKRTGKGLAGGVVTDGPYVESREIIGGYSIVQTESYEHALLVARECPITLIPNARIEIRELAGY